jgi:hypothetical protein
MIAFMRGIRTPGAHSGDLGAAEDLIDQRGLLGIAVADEEPHLRKWPEIPQPGGQLPRHQGMSRN